VIGLVAFNLAMVGSTTWVMVAGRAPLYVYLAVYGAILGGNALGALMERRLDQ
jgi:hypothetical protein